MFKKIKYFKDKPVTADILDLVVLCLITFIIAKIITSYVILNGHVPSGSMENTIKTGDRIIANRMAYWSSDPQRGDIVVFYSPDDEAIGDMVHFVKRVIGLPGDKIKIQRVGSVDTPELMVNKLFINGKEVEEPYLTDAIDETFPEVTVPEGCYFMLGDNRNKSRDSRFWTNKFVPRDEVLGKVVLKYSLNPSNFHFKTIESYNKY
jgi:signal peptidase I